MALADNLASSGLSPTHTLKALLRKFHNDADRRGQLSYAGAPGTQMSLDSTTVADT